MIPSGISDVGRGSMGRIKVLIAEDDLSTQDLYQKGLADDLFERRFASNGEEALHLYQQWRPDLLVLDIIMPVMTGYSVLREIRERLRDWNTKIVMATSLATKEDVRDCSRIGIQGYIVKPFKYREIGNVLQQYIQQDKRIAAQGNAGQTRVASLARPQIIDQMPPFLRR